MPMTTINGLPIRDAKVGLLLHVTADDVKKADRKAPATCAAAMACCRDGHVKEARIHLSRVYVLRGKYWERLFTPAPLRDEIISFDRGGTFEAGDFYLSPPSRAKRATGKRVGSHTNASLSRRSRRKPHIVQNVRNGPATKEPK